MGFLRKRLAGNGGRVDGVELELRFEVIWDHLDIFVVLLPRANLKLPRLLHFEDHRQELLELDLLS